MTADFWEKRRVLVTGSTGFIGSALVRRLKALEADTVEADLVSTSGPLAVDLTNSYDTFQLFADTRPTVVFHVAGRSHIGYCQANPLNAFDANVTTTAMVLAACRQFAPDAAVFASSNHVYGNLNDRPPHKRDPFRAGDALNPSDVYGSTKAAADVLVCAAAREGLPFVALRHVNIYGERDPHRDHLIPSLILRKIAGQPPVLRSDGSPRKAYLYIDDVVDAYLLVAQRAAEEAVRGPINCTPDRTTSVLDLVRAIGWPDFKPEPTTGTEQKDYLETLDGRYLRDLGWSQQVPLSTGLILTTVWYQKNP